jgi:predicted ribonuclease YlaK
MANFYQDPQTLNYDLTIGQYIIIKNEQGEIVDFQVKTAVGFRPLNYKNFKSYQIGDIRPIKDDPYQKFAFDSLSNNQITVLRGPAGSGKSLISMAYLFYLLEKHKIERIIIFVNPVPVRGAAKLGFYPGDRDTKLLDSQIGNFLNSKLGDKLAVERLIADGKLILIPMADARGYQTPPNSGVYVTEAQNMSIDLMKLFLQRIDDTSIVILDGDNKQQLDMSEYEGANNGMRRVSEVFRGKEFYGEVELRNVLRSRIAKTAEMM